MKNRKKNTALKKKVATKNYLRKPLLFFALLLVTVPLTLYLSQSQQTIKQQAQTTTAVPTYFCEGSCPTIDTNERASDTTTQNITTTNSPTNTPAPTPAPCSTSDDQLTSALLKLVNALLSYLSGQSTNSTTNTTSTPCDTSNTTASASQSDTNTTSDNSTSNTTDSSNTAATTDDCSGKYNLKNPRGENFGDPQCTFDKNQLYSVLQSIDADNADIWFNEVVPCESSFNPNAYASPKTGTPDKGGAWGLFQMGQGKNGKYDHGDVDWNSQASDAVNYNTLRIHDDWRYWACAKSHWN